MLSSLNCQSDHLKRSGIGMTVMALKRHKEETTLNKKLLKEIIEKWCRPLFGKSVDPRSMNNYEGSEELKRAAAQQTFQAQTQFTSAFSGIDKNSRFESMIDNRGGKIGFDRRGGNNSSNDNNLNPNDDDNNNNNSSQQPAVDIRTRVRTPYTNGYVFTVRPPEQVIDKQQRGDHGLEKFSETRSKLIKLSK